MKTKLHILSYLLIFCLFFICIQSYAQNLRRKGMIGVGLCNEISDSLRYCLKLSDNDGALVNMVVPNSTAALMKLQPHDLILSLNQHSISSPDDLLSVAKNLRNGDSLSASILRNGKHKTLMGIVQAKPYEQSETADVFYDEFKFKEGYVRSILTKPVNQMNAPVVFLIQGYTCSSIDNLPPDNPYRCLIDGFVEKGFAVFRIEKSGIGDNYNTSPCEEIGFNEELELFKTGYLKLLSCQEEIDTSNIFIFGHSLGGIIAPLLAEKYKPKGVIVFGTVVKPWHDYLLDIYRIQQPILGADWAGSQDTLELIRPTLFEIFYNNKSPENLKGKPTHITAMQLALNYDGENHFFDRHYTFWTELNRINVADAWKKTPSYVLSIYGEADIAVMNPEGHKEIVEIVNRYHPSNASYLALPETSHEMQKVGSMQDYISKLGNPEYQFYNRDCFNWEIINETCQWANDKLNK
ncbi:MAG: alpha/beta hydrolase [Bacteroidales bacterium]|nr:alpha/beta hydrolase [Bacteroidales bacterium]